MPLTHIWWCFRPILPLMGAGVSSRPWRRAPPCPEQRADCSPEYRLDEHEYRVILELMTSVPKHALGDRLGSVAAYRDEITRGIDWLFTGV